MKARMTECPKSAVFLEVLRCSQIWPWVVLSVRAGGIQARNVVELPRELSSGALGMGVAGFWTLLLGRLGLEASSFV